jgi:shikimate kinase
MTSSLPPVDRSIVLVGLMGVGKTTIGRRLAKRLRLDFVDSDSEIELACGCSVSEIFERFGEPSFRDGERRVIARLVEGSPKVLATGGGAFMDPRTRALILENCIAIWLDADPAVLAERVARRDSRPLLKNKDPLAVLQSLAEIRNPIYAEAHIHIRSEPVPHDSAVEHIVAALARWQQDQLGRDETDPEKRCR